MRTVLFAAAAAALIFNGCESPAGRDVLVIGLGTEPGVLLPVAEASALDGEINAQLYLKLNSARWVNGALDYLVDELSLAERWTYSRDSTVLTYHLREEAVWSDGEPIDAEDVRFTFQLVRRPEIGSVYADSWEHLDSVAVVDDHTVAFHFRRRYPGMLFHTGIGIIPQHIYEEYTVGQASLTSHPSLLEPGPELVVSGPYSIGRWVRGERLLLVENPRAFTTRPATDTVVLRLIPDETTRLLEFENGELDVTTPLEVSQAQEIEEDPRFRIETMDDRFYDYIAWNGSEYPPFADPHVRRALSLAIDRRGIIDGQGLDRFARPAAGPYPPIFAEVSDPSLEPDPYLPDSARAVLAAQGWRDSDGDGLLDREGTPFSFTLLTQAGNERRNSAAQIIQAAYREIGIDMRIRPVEFNALLGLMFEGRDFEAVLMGWQVALAPNYLAGFFWPPGHPYNITGYASAELDRLIPEALAAPNASAAAPYWREAARTIAAGRPYAFLWYYDDIVAVNEKVRNTRMDTYGLLQNLHEWTVHN
ncbi:MAG: hypothetical protein GWN99_18420 [Gemmatimonadetes bacterium]|uniref:Solute-binding protein family 5 domain-containing protein n=1 Tax=Candidatus Kutchimonas denitrificans TaxID=3056748 RepID=A0AAE4Z6Q3_9BACT|nr:hypothetical protein [Gemmatimonadota bacterium]NIR74023.1 hypothetical protein [Candidatus Kutchimonas denitrificans]NIS03012.1 hypothetical protein [Gemmatimonadota bacterium]NIT68729.1 hypothetical protein [Gemmatimonadota bacterium]NIU53310.1 hypothetical protein [Gemmatimonadota bacterium]